MGKIKITGTAKREVAADVMNIIIAISAKGKTPELAIREGKEDVEKLLQLLVNLGIDITKVEMQEEEVSDGSRYSDDKSEYKFSKRVNIKAALNLKLLETLGTGIADNRISAVYVENFYYSNERSLERELVREALMDSREQAFSLAEALGQSVKGMEEIIGEEYGSVTGYHEAEMSCPYMFGGDSLSAELAPHVLEFEKKINVIWLVE